MPAPFGSTATGRERRGVNALLTNATAYRTGDSPLLDSMTAAAPAFDHGAALRVPPDHDVGGWGALMAWLGAFGRRLPRPGCVEVLTEAGRVIAAPGDWIVLSVSGDFHVTMTAARAWDA